MAVYDSQTGAQLQYLSGGEYNNVDLRQGFTSGGKSVSLVVASRQDTKALGIWRVDPTTRKLVSVTAGVSTTLDNNYGLCLGRAGSKTYAYVNSEGGEVEQIRLRGNGSGKVSGAGGGGFLFFMVPPERRPRLLKALAREPGLTMRCCFTEGGAHAWRV